MFNCPRVVLAGELNDDFVLHFIYFISSRTMGFGRSSAGYIYIIEVARTTVKDKSFLSLVVMYYL